MGGKKNSPVSDYVLWLADTVCIIFSYWLATVLRFWDNNDWGDKRLHYAVLPVILLVYTTTSLFAGWNKDFKIRGYFEEFVAIAKASIWLIASALAIVFFAGWTRILSRQVVWNFVFFGVSTSYFCHCIYKAALRKATAKYASKVLVVAKPDRADEIMSRLRKTLGSSYQLIGFASIGDEKNSDEYAASFENLTAKLTQVAFDEVVIDTAGLTAEDVSSLVDGFEDMGVVCRCILFLPDTHGVSPRMEGFGGYSTATYRRVEIARAQAILKRVMDIVGGIAGCIITGILLIFVAPAIKLTSPGPVFFSQTRIGKNGRRFKIYKFRSMYQDAEKRKKELEQENEVKGLMFKMENDPRITKVGEFLRSTSLDEFPQFWNVLKGDMSLVGTRPPTVDEFEQYNEHYRRRLSMTPGLTGMWQVSGRSDISDFDEVVRLDLKYIDNWSIGLDIKILLQTVLVVLRHKGAK